VPGLTVNGAAAPRHPGNLNVQFLLLDADALLHALQPMVAASTGAACTSRTLEPSHVLRAIGLSRRAAEASIRFSVGRFTTETEVERALSILKMALNHAGGL
jgi:cysteine desulfurase